MDSPPPSSFAPPRELHRERSPLIINMDPPLASLFAPPRQLHREHFPLINTDSPTSSFAPQTQLHREHSPLITMDPPPPLSAPPRDLHREHSPLIDTNSPPLSSFAPPRQLQHQHSPLINTNSAPVSSFAPPRHLQREHSPLINMDLQPPPSSSFAPPRQLHREHYSPLINMDSPPALSVFAPPRQLNREHFPDSSSATVLPSAIVSPRKAPHWDWENDDHQVPQKQPIAAVVPPTVAAPKKVFPWDFEEDDVPATHQPGSPIATYDSDADPSSPQFRYCRANHIAPRFTSVNVSNDPADQAGRSRGSAEEINARNASIYGNSDLLKAIESAKAALHLSQGVAEGDQLHQDWMSKINALTSGTSTATDRKRTYYYGNIKTMIDQHRRERLAIDDLESIMHTYGVDETNIQEIVKRIDPAKYGSFQLTPGMYGVLLAPNINFCDPLKDPLTNLRHASKCFQKNLLSTLHFAGYILDILKKGPFSGNEPPFMILGLHSVLGVLEGGTGRKLTTKDVKTFLSLWKIQKPYEAVELTELIDDGYNGSISGSDFYNLLYCRNDSGKQRIQMFDLVAPQNLYMFFVLMDKDQDNIISSSDLRSFASVFGRCLTNDEIKHLMSKLDRDGDGRVNFNDYQRTIIPLIDGLAWEFWLAAILLKLEL